MADTLQSRLQPSPLESELDRKKRELAEQRYASGGMVPSPEEKELDQQKRDAAMFRYAQSDAPSRNEPTVTESAAGSPPSDVTPVGGVSDTVTQTQSDVNKLLGRKPSAGKLRDAVSAYEKAAAGLREQNADTSDIDAALAQAKQGYADKVSRNELLSLVQMVAQGFANLAAYNYGSKTGRYIADQVKVPTVDYEARSDRALKELQLEQGDVERGRSAAERAADRRYLAEKDRIGSLRERIGAEETVLSRESQMYDAELSAARNAASEASREQKADARDKSLEEKFNRQFGAKEVDNVQQEEAVLRQKEQAVTALAGALAADDKRSRAAIPSLAAKAGVTPEEVEKFRADSEKKGLLWDSEDPKAAAAALSKSLLPGVRERLSELRRRKQTATEMMRTGESLEQVRSRLESQPEASAPRVIRSKSTNETRPYTEDLWNKIQSSPQAADFVVE